MLLLQVIVGGLLLGAIYALFSSGLTLIWGMMNFINFAHGEFVMLGMYVALLVVVWLGGGRLVFGFASAFALFVLGVAIYVSLIRYVLRGPMLSQILSTFGLALLLALHRVLHLLGQFRVAAANLALRDAQCRRDSHAGGAARRGRRRHRADSRIASVADAHDRRQQAARGLRGSQRRDADGHQAGPHAGARLGLVGGRAGIAGALMAISYPWSPSVGETFGLTAFVVVALGGFGSVPGALYAGLIIGLIQARVGVLVRPDLQGHRGLRAVRRATVAAAARIDG